VISIYIAEIELGDRLTRSIEFSSAGMNRLLAEGTIQTYGVSKDNSRMWVTFLAGSELEAKELVAKLPVQSVTDPIVTPLSTYNQSIDLRFPAIIWN